MLIISLVPTAGCLCRLLNVLMARRFGVEETVGGGLDQVRGQTGSSLPARTGH